METNKYELSGEEINIPLQINNEDVSMQVIHENVIINKSIIETNKYRITKRVNEETELFDIPLVHDEIDIKTIPINEYVDVMPEPIRYEGDTTIIPVLREVHVVRILLEKEIHITKKKIETKESKTIVLRKEEIIIENILPSDENQQNRNR